MRHFNPRCLKTQSGRFRRGLAPVEMAIALPLLMLFMATIIAFGYAASWKTRSEVVARNVAWRDRHPRWANSNARALEWPEPATMNRFADCDLGTFADDEILDAPIIVGPIPQVNVNSETLNFSRDVVIGEASIIRTPPVLPRLGQIQFDTEHPVLDDRFQYAEMGISNYSRRIPIIYQTDLDFILDSAGIQNAVAAIDNSPNRIRLLPLDEDEEFIAWYGTAPDFHPRVYTRGFRLDRNWVRINRVESLLRGIDRVPQTMVRATISLYRDQLRSTQSVAAQMELQRKIDALESYLDNLRNR